jgi:hypothetical protein
MSPTCERTNGYRSLRSVSTVQGALLSSRYGRGEQGTAPRSTAQVQGPGVVLPRVRVENEPPYPVVPDQRAESFLKKEWCYHAKVW